MTCALCSHSIAVAQDERRVTSPNGQIEFRLFIATQGNSNLSRIAYEVFLTRQAPDKHIVPGPGH